MLFYIFLCGYILCLGLCGCALPYYRTHTGALRIRRGFHTEAELYAAIFSVATLLALWFLTAFRSAHIGNDTVTYIDYFRRFRSDGIQTDNQFIEIGYQWFCWLIGKFTSNAHIFLMICATICYAASYRFIKRFSVNIPVSLCLLFAWCFSFFNSGLRQSIAMVIVLSAYRNLKKNKPKTALCWIFIASTFHKTSLCALLLFFRRFFPYRLRFVYPLSFLLILMSILHLWNGALYAVLSFSDYHSAGYLYSVYAERGRLGVTQAIIMGNAYYYIVYSAYKKNRNERKLELSVFLFYLLTACMGYAMNQFLRVSMYFQLIMTAELPNAVFEGKNWYKRPLMFGLCAVNLLYFLLILWLRPEWNHLYPYEFWR